MVFKNIFVDILVHFITGVLSQVEHDNTPMALYESRWIDYQPWPIAPGDQCSLTVQRYFIKKRRTRRRIAGQNLRYQFIASSELLTPNTLPLPGELDHFASQYGWIFCERGVIMGLEMRLHARHCGIEDDLAALCVMDNDVNLGPDFNLNLMNIMPDNSQVVNTRFFRNLIIDNCFKFIEVKLPRIGTPDHYEHNILQQIPPGVPPGPRLNRLRTIYGLTPPQEIFSRAWILELLRAYLQGPWLLIGNGSRIASPNNVVLKQRCGTYVTWRNYFIEDFTLDTQFTHNTYTDTVDGSWYLCVPK